MTAPFSTVYDDVYFSASGGLAEKRHVFLAGNGFPERFRSKRDTVIAEAGFGTGLSFLATLQMFLATTEDDQWLHFTSFEAHPLTPNAIRDALAPWATELAPLVDELVQALPRPFPGVHRMILSDRVVLTLVYGDINVWLPDIEMRVDAWFLDGFTPAKNPAMWSPTLFGAIAEKSVTGATAATYSAARVVKDGLARAGFTPEKRPGFGYKSDMLCAVRNVPGCAPLSTRRGQRVIIQGGGLAGTAAAYVLKKLGQDPVIVAPAGLADQASGNPRGLYNPRFTQDFTGTGQFYASAFSRFHDFLRKTDPNQTGWIANGAVHLLREQDKDAARRAITSAWGWGERDARIIAVPETKEITGLNLDFEALWLPHAGSVCPQKICAFYAAGIDVRPDMPNIDETDKIVVASGPGILSMPEFSSLPLHGVRGQISYVHGNAASSRLQTNLCYGGYLSAIDADQMHVLGATFQRWRADTVVDDADHRYVLDQLAAVMDFGWTEADITGGRASLRLVSRDHMPVIGGYAPDQIRGPNTYVTLAHGSHGLLSTHLGGWILAEAITGISPGISRSAAQAIRPDRFNPH